nr:MAG: capsid protein [Cressdnaviricota sp.]
MVNVRRNWGRAMGHAYRYIKKNPGKVKQGFWNTVGSATGLATGLGARYNNRPKQKKPKLHQQVRQSGQGGSISTFNYGRRKMPRALACVYKSVARNYFATNGAGRKTATVGNQQAFDDLHMFDATDVGLITAKITANKTNRFYLLSCSAELLMTNQELSNCRYTIYDIIARRDINAAANDSPGTAWATSYADEGGSNSDYQIVGSTPFSSDLFTQFFKVIKVTHGVLAQGQTHCHKIQFHPMRLIDGEYIQSVTYGYKGLSCYTMVVYHGEPQNDSTTKTQVSTGASTLDIVYRKQYKYTWLNDVDTTWSKTNTLPSSFTVNPSIVDIGSGTIVTDSAA